MLFPCFMGGEEVSSSDEQLHLGFHRAVCAWLVLSCELCLWGAQAKAGHRQGPLQEYDQSNFSDMCSI